MVVLPLIRSSIYLIIYLVVLVEKVCTSVKSIPRSFVLFDAVTNGTVFLLSFSECLLCQLTLLGVISTPTRIPSLGCGDEGNVTQCKIARL